MELLKNAISFLKARHPDDGEAADIVTELEELNKRLDSLKSDIATYNISASAGRFFPLEVFLRDAALSFNLKLAVVSHVKHWTWHKIYATLQGPEEQVKACIQAINKHCKAQGW